MTATKKKAKLFSKDATLETKIIKARAALVMKHPFFGSIVLRLRMVESKEVPTMGTDTVRLLYNPDFVKKLTHDELCAVLAHEVMHVVFMHPLRIMHRAHEVWNAAGDYTINPILRNSGFKLPDPHLYDEKYADKTADEVYTLIRQDYKTTKTSGGGGGGQGDGNGQGQQQGGGCEHHHSDEHGDACGGIIPLKHPSGRSMTESEARHAEDLIKAAISQARTVAKTVGNMPSDLERLVSSILDPEVDWTNQLRKFVEIATKNDYSWDQPNRRYLHQNLYMPRMHSQQMDTLAVAIDTSGSVSQDELNIFASEISAILDTVDLKQIVVIYCDAAVAGVEYFDKYDLPLQLRVRGGGGTDFVPPFEWLEENDITPSCFIYMTDMWCYNFPPEPDYPVMWLATTDRDEVPFGEVLKVNLTPPSHE